MMARLSIRNLPPSDDGNIYPTIRALMTPLLLVNHEAYEAVREMCARRALLFTVARSGIKDVGALQVSLILFIIV